MADLKIKPVASAFAAIGVTFAAPIVAQAQSSQQPQPSASAPVAKPEAAAPYGQWTVRPVATSVVTPRDPAQLQKALPDRSGLRALQAATQDVTGDKTFGLHARFMGGDINLGGSQSGYTHSIIGNPNLKLIGSYGDLAGNKMLVPTTETDAPLGRAPKSRGFRLGVGFTW